MVELCDQLMQLGVDDVYLADTNGRGTAPATRRLLDRVLDRVPVDRLGCHFHDTYGQAIANLDVALLAGVVGLMPRQPGWAAAVAPGATEKSPVRTCYAARRTGIERETRQQFAEVGQVLCEKLNCL